MKNYPLKQLFFIGLFLALFCACFPKETTQVITTVQIDSATNLSPEALTDFKTKLAERISTRFDINKIEASKTSNELVVDAQIGDDDLAIFNSLFVSNKLDFWDTYQIKDAIINSIDTAKLQVENFVSFKAIGVPAFQREVLGKCANESKLQEVLTKLSNNLSDIENLKLIWSEESQNGYYDLFMINTKGKTAPPLTEYYISKAIATNDIHTGGLVVNLAFDAMGAKKWANLTTKAANDGNRSIAIVINDRVFTCPRVMSPIMSGNASISGDFSMTEATSLAESLQAKRLKYDLRILDQQIVEKK